MNSRELVKNIIDRKDVPRCAFWLGNPHPDMLPVLLDYFKMPDEESLRLHLGDDLRWLTPQYTAGVYRHPEGKGIFDLWKYKDSLGEAGPLAACEDINELDDYEWPNPDYLDFSGYLPVLENAGDYYRASGFWAPFFHDIADLFGMENYFLKMYTHPEVVQAVTERVCGFYMEANERFYAEAGDLLDGYFFGNDFGTQMDLLITPEQFGEYLLPWIRRFADQAHRHGYQVLFHSCGSVARIIPLLIGAGVDCLHPLQAKAHRMDAASLAEEFGGHLAFMGGIDTQDILVNASPGEVREEVRRVRKLLGPHLIISPSHEALLPNVPPENVLAMAEAALEK